MGGIYLGHLEIALVAAWADAFIVHGGADGAGGLGAVAAVGKLAVAH